MKRTQRQFYLFTGLFIAFALFALAFSATLTARAASGQPQVVTTPTPDAEGNILYTVQAGDTCLSIALRFLNGDVNKLRDLNQLNEACGINENQKLLLGTFIQPSATPGPSPTPTIPLPSPTPFPGNGEICILLYNDINGNAMLEPGEAAIPAGAISIMDVKGEITRNGKTGSEPDPVCFSDLPEKEYNISVGPPEGYNPTTAMNYTLKLKAGDKSIMNFGAQLSSAAAPVPVNEGGRSPILAIFGILLLLAGLMLGLYFVFLRRTPPSDPLPPSE